MDTTGQQKPEKEDLTRYVDELRSKDEYPEGDAWMSLTDAARVTRTSEAMARRWVSSGRIPVKKEAVGIPPRTRLVRLSDVAAVRPIVDPTAAITGDVRKLDLASIPRQQLQIMEEHQHLLQEAATLQRTVEQFSTSLQETLDQQALRITTLDETHSRTLQALKIALAEMNADLERVRLELTNATEQRAAELRQEIKEEQRERQQDTQALTTRLQTQDQESQARLQQATTQLLANQQAQDQKLEETNTEVAQAKGTIGQVQRNLQQARKDLQTAIENAYQKATKEATTQISQQARQLQTQLENLERDQARDVATLTTQFESISSRLEQMSTTISNVKATTENNQQRAITQEGRMDALQRELEQEREARRMLTQQLQQGQRAKGRRTEPTG